MIKMFKKVLKSDGKEEKTIPTKTIPLDISHVQNFNKDMSTEEVNNWIINGIKCFKEWYQPIDFGDGIIANVTRPPEWNDAPEFNDERGLGKWKFIIRRNLPDLSNKRVLDLGCNNGIISLQMCREGAKSVIGIDRNENIHQKTYPELPAQDIVAQANFVKNAFELKEKISFPVEYLAAEVSEVGNLNLGKFDIVVALCVLYHEMENMPVIIADLAKMTDHLVLQTSLTHGGELAKWADLYKHVEILHKAGFDKITIDAPIGFHLPMIIGQK